MPELIPIDEYRLLLLMPRGLPEPEARRVARILNTARFRRRLERAAREAVRSHTALARVRIAVAP